VAASSGEPPSAEAVTKKILHGSKKILFQHGFQTCKSFNLYKKLLGKWTKYINIPVILPLNYYLLPAVFSVETNSEVPYQQHADLNCVVSSLHTWLF
jgi:hypothetical protein